MKNRIIDRFLPTLRTARFFAKRKGKADFVQFRNILLRKASLLPREGDTIDENGIGSIKYDHNDQKPN